MKINVRHLVFLFLGLFLVKIVIADPFRLNRDKTSKKKNPTVKTSQVNWR